MSRFASIKTAREPVAAKALEAGPRPSGKAPSRLGKRLVGGHFSPDVLKGLNLLALELDVSLQALLGEAFDDLMRKYGKHPFGER